MFKTIERRFCLICVSATLLGLLVPAAGAPLAPLLKVFLAGILFFTGLKLDLRAAMGELRRPLLLGYLAAMMLVVLPVGVWGLARLAVPSFAVGVLILAAMPAGMATTSLCDIIRGNAPLALVVTLVTCALCPLTAPLVIRLAEPGPGQGGGLFLAGQAGFLAVILFAPLTAAYLVRKTLPGLVGRHRDSLTGLAIVSLALLILGAMSACSGETLRMIRQSPARAAGLIGFLCAFSALLHVAGYYLAPWRPSADRAALSINTAYVNNALGIVFARQFFVPTLGAAAMLPAVLLEIPMVLAIPVVGMLLNGRRAAGKPAKSA